METPTSIWTWPNVIAGTIIAVFSAAAGALINWRKLPSEVHKVDAEAELTSEQAADLRFKRQLTATEMFSEMAADLGEAQFDKVQMRKELDRANRRIAVLETEIEQYKANRILARIKSDGSKTET